MNYQIEKKTQIPAYIQLYKQLLDDIVNGYYPKNTKLPSKRVIASNTQTSIITVQHALDLLIDEGYVEPKERSGYFVIFDQEDFNSVPTQLTISYKDQPHTKGNFPLSVLQKAMRKVISNLGDNILSRTDNKGSLELRTTLDDYLARSRGIHVSPDQIVIGAGAEYLYGIIAQLFQNEKSIAIEDPGYHKIELVYKNYGKQCEKLKLYNNGISKESLKNTKSHILHVTPFHSYPSGVSIEINKKNEYLKWATMNDGYIIEDNYDSELTVSKKQEDSLFALSKDQRVIYMNTFSKTISPSMRLGYIILPVELMKIFDERLSFYTCTVPVFNQFVLNELIISGDLERHINKVRRQKRKALHE